MPVHKVGYRSWDGTKTPIWSRWSIITKTGFRVGFKSAWVRRLLLLCWLPIVYWGVAIFLFEQTLQRNRIDQDSDTGKATWMDRVEDQMQQDAMERLAGELADRLEMLPQVDTLVEIVRNVKKPEVRHKLWSWLLMLFFRYPQGTAVLFLLGFIAPPLISQDVRSRAFLLYFSRPLGMFGYIFGKFMVPAAYLILVTTLPALVLYVFGLMLSPDLSVIRATWDIPIRILLASLTMIIPTCSIALMFSSVTQESRFATFAWFAFWTLGHTAWFAIAATRAAQLHAKHSMAAEVLNDPIVNRWSVVSLYNNLASVQSWVFGFEPFEKIWPSALLLVALTVGSLVILFRGVSAPTKV